MVRAGVIGGAIGLGLVTEDALSESFLYDDKDRLTKADLPATLTDMNIGYTTNNLGNIASKTGQGTYTYSSSKLYALKTIQNTDNTVSSSNQIITYNTFQQPSLITESNNTLSFLYGSDDERRKTTRKYNFSGVNNEVEKRTFLGNYEVLETRACTQLSCTAWTTQQIHYVASGPGYQIIAVRTGTTGAFTFYYAYTDYLGSILRVTNATGALLADGKQSFDAWGRKRNPTTWTYTAIPAVPTWLYRGYTGHETLSQFNLINMNGRLYDPVVGRMLSLDNFVQDPMSTQSHNRYTYALNNPLKYRDPDGEWVHLVIGAIIGGTINWLANGAQLNAKGLGYFGVGALAGALSAGIGAGVGATIAGNAAAGGGFAAGFLGTATISSTGFVAGATVGASAGFTNGFLTGTGNGLLGGQNFGQSLVGGLNSGWKQGLIGGVTGGVFGGIDAASKGRDFWTGNAKQFKGTEALYASLDGGSDVYINTDDYTVFNQSGKDVYYKPEDGAYGLSNKIKTGHGIKIDVDGIATSKYTNQVFKIPGKLGFSPNALVKAGGDVQLNFSTLDKAALNYQLWRNPNYHYGWSTIGQLDNSWKMLFHLSTLIR